MSQIPSPDQLLTKEEFDALPDDDARKRFKRLLDQGQISTSAPWLYRLKNLNDVEKILSIIERDQKY